MFRGSKKAAIKRFLAWFSGLKQNERILLSLVALGLFGWSLSIPAAMLQDYIADNERLTEIRKGHLEEASFYLKRYQERNRRLQKLQTTFEESRLTFEQVYDEVDRIVKDSIGSDDYVLRKSRDATSLGSGYSRQDFTLTINTITIDQLIKLLYQLEQGETPLFLGKVNITGRATKKGTRKVTLDVTSIGKSQASGSSAT